MGSEILVDMERKNRNCIFMPMNFPHMLPVPQGKRTSTWKTKCFPCKRSMHGGLLVCIYLTNKSNQLHSMQIYPHIPAIFANTYQDSLFGFLYAQSLLTISQCLLNPQRTSPGDVWLWQAPGVTIASSRSCPGAVRNQLTYHPRSYTSDGFLS